MYAARKYIIPSVVACFSLLIDPLRADTVGWWRFDELQPGNQATQSCPVTNSVSPTVGKGAAISIDGTTEGTDSAYMPRYVSARQGAIQSFVYDPVSGQSYANAASMAFDTSGATSSALAGLKGGAVRIPDDEAFHLKDFTVEMFVCTTGGLFNTIAPLVGKVKNGNWVGESWQIGLLLNGKLFMRYDATAAGTNGEGTHVINDGAWHHLALTCSYDKDAGVSTYTMYVDHEFDFSKTKNGAVAYGTSGNNDIYVGGYGYSGGRKFNGFVDELRISDAVLATGQFLSRRCTAPDFLDGDTLVYIPFDAMAGLSWNVAGTPLGVTAGKVGDVPPAAVSGEVPCPAVRAGFSVPAEAANTASMQFRTNGAVRAGSLLNLPDFAYTADDLTVELFFKAGTEMSSSGDAQMLFKIAETPYLQAMLSNTYPGQILLVYNNYFTGSAVWQAPNVGSGLDDGEWHHLAVAYDAGEHTLKCFIDYAQVLSKTSVTLNSASTKGTVGSRVAKDQQFFNGWIDEFRITRRALGVEELLNGLPTVMHEEADTVFRASMDGDFSVTAHSPSWLVSGTGSKRNEESETCRLPEFSASVRWPWLLLDGIDGRNTVTNAGSVLLSGGQVTFNNVPGMGAYDQTVELFCNIDSMPEFAGLVRLNNSTSGILGVNPVYALYGNSDGTLRLRCTMEKNGSVDSMVYLSTGVTTASLGGGWHHFAMTAERKEASDTTEFAFYVDGELSGSAAAPGSLYADTALGFNIMVGAATREVDVVGYFDELRISRGVLPADRFLRRYRARRGMSVIIR